MEERQLERRMQLSTRATVERMLSEGWKVIDRDPLLMRKRYRIIDVQEMEGHHNG